MIDVNTWSDYPMGPTLMAYLGIRDQQYQGDKAPRPDDHRAQEFCGELIKQFQSEPIDTFDEWVNILEELTAMGLGKASIFLAEEDFREPAKDDFRSMLAIGCSYMLEGDHENACSFLENAQAIEPAETSSYVNIARIHYSLESDEKALTWAYAGLDVDPNNGSLWEVIASIYLTRDKEAAGQQLREEAEKRNSFMGLSLAADIISPDDTMLKAEWLELLCDTPAEDNPQFFIEYTAALGMARQYEKIPPMVLKAQRMKKAEVPWQLHAHALQAHIAMENLDTAKSTYETLKKSKDIPTESLAALEHEIKDLEETLKK